MNRRSSTLVVQKFMIFLLTFTFYIYIEADKIRNIAFLIDEDGEPKRSWKIIEQVAKKGEKNSRKERSPLFIFTFGKNFEETLNAYNNFGEDNNPDRLFKIIYHLEK